MITTLTPMGDRLGLVLDEAILERLKIDEQTPLEVTSDGTGLYIRPIPLADDQEVLRSVDRMLSIHAETFRKLAE